jgi:hypothetical protein
MALHNQLKPMVSGCCKRATDVHRLVIVNGECITGVHGYIGMVVDWVEFSTPSRSIKKGSGVLQLTCYPTTAAPSNYLPALIGPV